MAARSFRAARFKGIPQTGPQDRARRRWRRRHKQGDVMGVKNLGRFDNQGHVPQAFATIAFHIAAVARAGNGARSALIARSERRRSPGARCRSEG